MSLLGRTNNRSHTTAGVEDTVWVPSAGAYLTDGATLFCVGHTLSDNVNGELFLELENCCTSDVVLCPARAVTPLGLRSVTPAIAV
jgi:hypothetical protein